MRYKSLTRNERLKSRREDPESLQERVAMHAHRLGRADFDEDGVTLRADVFRPVDDVLSES